MEIISKETALLICIIVIIAELVLLWISNNEIKRLKHHSSIVDKMKVYPDEVTEKNRPLAKEMAVMQFEQLKTKGESPDIGDLYKHYLNLLNNIEPFDWEDHWPMIIERLKEKENKPKSESFDATDDWTKEDWEVFNKSLES